MNWKFWKQKPFDETTIQVDHIEQRTDGGTNETIYVKAQTSEKALELYKKLSGEREHA